MQGIIKWYSKERGYGFVTNHNQEDVFLHADDLLSHDRTKGFNPGERVDFEVLKGPKGPRAVQLRRAI